jgi:hypothetical protein
LPLKWYSQTEGSPRRHSKKKTTSKTPSPSHQARWDWIFTRKSTNNGKRHQGGRMPCQRLKKGNGAWERPIIVVSLPAWLSPIQS